MAVSKHALFENLIGYLFETFYPYLTKAFLGPSPWRERRGRREGKHDGARHNFVVYAPVITKSDNGNKKVYETTIFT